MSFLDTLFPVLMNMLYVGMALVSIRYLYLGYFFIIRKNELVYVRSQISALKLKLRARLNQKLNATQASGVSELKTTVNKILEEIRLLDFVKTTDYQTLIYKIIEINEAYDTHNILHNKNAIVPSSTDVSIAPEFDKIRETCQAVFEFEPDLLCLIIEIAKFTEEYIKRAHDYNHFTVHEKKIPQIKDIPEKIQIEHFYVFEELYKQHRAVLEAKISQARLLQASNDTNLSSIPTSLVDP
ncbi:MAG: hypothetical protein K2P92_02985, partial [Bdellovibrionaceae bacterium]|nr:hypothetical protein [Pseudobdellovibrionaceae bacterium]